MTGILTTKDYIHFTIVPDDITFSGSEKANKCLPGDLVMWNFTEERCESITPADHGKIIGILELTSKTRYGLTSRGAPVFLFRPLDSSYPPFIAGTGQKDLTKNVLCSIIYRGEWKAPSAFPKGEICEYFGPVGDWKAERAAILARWCQNAPAKLNRLDWESREPSDNMFEGREDLSWGLSFHIDPEGCRDVDDILTIGDISVEDGSFKLAITIADVAALVKPESNIACAAAKMGQTFYDDSGKVLRSMLPAILSEQVCSLRSTSSIPVWKLGISLILTINNNSVVGEPELKLTKILSTYVKTYTYDNFLNNVTNSYRATLLRQTKLIYRALESALSRNAEFPDNTHTLVETTMLYYNWWVGNFLAKSGAATEAKTLYRVQDVSDAKRIHSWRAAGEANECGMELVRQGTAAAEYTLGGNMGITQRVHEGLGLKNYCHASSPIRRFADLWVQWIIHVELNKGCTLPDITSMEYFKDIVPWLNGRAQAVKKFSRDIAIIGALERGEREFGAVCLEWKCNDGEPSVWKGKFWVEHLKQIVNVRQFDDKPRCAIGCRQKLRMGINWVAGKWKERIIVEIICAPI